MRRRLTCKQRAALLPLEEAHPPRAPALPPTPSSTYAPRAQSQLRARPAREQRPTDTPPVEQRALDGVACEQWRTHRSRHRSRQSRRSHLRGRRCGCGHRSRCRCRVGVQRRRARHKSFEGPSARSLWCVDSTFTQCRAKLRRCHVASALHRRREGAVRCPKRSRAPRCPKRARAPRCPKRARAPRCPKRAGAAGTEEARQA